MTSPLMSPQDPAAYQDQSTSYATIVTLLPYMIIERKPGLIPGQFEIPKAAINDFEVLVIKDSFHYVYLDSDRGSIPAIDPALKVAQSIVYDYVSCQLLREEGAEPGLFCVPGKLSKNEVKMQYGPWLEEAKARQRNWYKKLVALADDDWAMNRKRKGISDLSRHAATALLLDREWLKIVEEERPVQVAAVECPACFSAVRQEAMICAACKTILKPKEWNELQAKQVIAPQVK